MMKIIILSLILSALTFAQDATQPAQKSYETAAAKIIAEMHAKGGSVKNSPFSADEENESVQTLADGNRIVRKSTGKIYRNSEGRVRREIKGGQGGMFGSMFMFGDGVSIAHPAMGQKLWIDDAMKTATIVGSTGNGFTFTPKAGTPGEQNVTITRKLDEVTKNGEKTSESVVIENKNGVITKRPMTDEEKAKMHEKFKSAKQGVAIVESEGVVIDGQGGLLPGQSAGGVIARTFGGPIGSGTFAISTDSGKYESKTDDLGTREFDGVSATGTRHTTTIPAGAIGNERPIEIVYERWYSKDLGMVVYSKNIDPRFGEQTYRLTNINRVEPDPSLFTVPQGYKTITTSGGKVNVASPGAYRIVTTKTDAEKASPKPNQ